MATLHRARVVAFGAEKDMIRLCQVMLNNSDWLEDAEDTDDRPPLTLQELITLLRNRSQVEGGAACEFYYGMLTTRIYGQADPASCRMSIHQEACGLWTAAFSYDSDEPFQQEDWLRLHLSCGRVPMLVLRASEDFARAKGMLIITGGRILESWDHMDECWLYLMRRYGCGDPPEEAVNELCHLEKAFEREDCDLTISELLEGCMENLQETAQRVADQEGVQAEMLRCQEQKDYQGLFSLQCDVAAAALWETERNAFWLANLSALSQAWQEHLEA